MSLARTCDFLIWSERVLCQRASAKINARATRRGGGGVVARPPVERRSASREKLVRAAVFECWGKT